MSTFNEALERYRRFHANDHIPCHYLKNWVKCLRMGQDDVRSILVPRRRQCFESRTRGFLKSLFFNRPEVVSLIKDFMEECGLPQELIDKTLKFEYLYEKNEAYILLLRFLQGKPENGHSRTQSDIADYFNTSDVTIGKYVSELRDGISIFGSRIEADPIRGTNECESTVHPVFLPLNLVGAYTLISALEEHDSDDIRARIRNSLADEICAQLTPYAKDKLRAMLGKSSAINDLDGDEEDGPRQAYAPADTRRLDEALIFNAKEQQPCRITAETDDGLITYEGYVSLSTKDCRNIHIRVENGDPVELPWRHVVRAESL